MKRTSFYLAVSLLALLGATGCSRDMFATRNTPQDLQQAQASANSVKPEPKKEAQTNYASDGSDCNGRANKRLTMYDKPDTYPISDKERHDAYLALYSECMREHDWQVAGPAHSAPAYAPAYTQANSAGSFANLSPAAGGALVRPANTVNANGTLVSSSNVQGATVVVIGGNGANTANQLSSLSPAAGGAYPQNATVVLVSPQAVVPATSAYIPAMPRAPLPVAVPVPPPPMARAYAPATVSTTTTTTSMSSPASLSPSAGMHAPTPLLAKPVNAAAYIPRSNNNPPPSLAGAEAAVTGTGTHVASQESANQQLENALEK